MNHSSFSAVVALALILSLRRLAASEPPDQNQKAQRGLRPVSRDHRDEALSLSPNEGSFAIVQGRESCNRSLCGGSSPIRVDAGDQPEFSILLPGVGGNLRTGLATASGAKWLHEAESITARYQAGRMIYQIRDKLAGDGVTRLEALQTPSHPGLRSKRGHFITFVHCSDPFSSRSRAFARVISV